MRGDSTRRIRTLTVLASVAAVGATCGVTIVMGGCSAVLGIESDRHLVVKEDAGNGAVAPVEAGAETGVPSNWACIDDPPPTPVAGPVRLKLFINDVSTAATTNDFAGTPVPFAALRACGTLDVLCETPVGMATSDDAGVAVITLPPQFRGYYELSAPGYTSGLLARPPQLVDESAQQGVASLTLISLGGQLAGVTADPNLGIGLISVIDCNSDPAANMLIEVGVQGQGEKLVYLEKSLPSAHAKATDGTGSAIIYNLPPGTLTVSAKFPDSGRMVRSVTTLARSKWVTFVQIRLDQARIVPLDAGR